MEGIKLTRKIIRCKIIFQKGWWYYAGKKNVKDGVGLFTKDKKFALSWNDESLMDKHIAFMIHNAEFKSCYGFEIIKIPI